MCAQEEWGFTLIDEQSRKRQSRKTTKYSVEGQNDTEVQDIFEKIRWLSQDDAFSAEEEVVVLCSACCRVKHLYTSVESCGYFVLEDDDWDELQKKTKSERAGLGDVWPERSPRRLNVSSRAARHKTKRKHTGWIPFRKATSTTRKRKKQNHIHTSARFAASSRSASHQKILKAQTNEKEKGKNKNISSARALRVWARWTLRLARWVIRSHAFFTHPTRTKFCWQKCKIWKKNILQKKNAKRGPEWTKKRRVAEWVSVVVVP